LSKKNHCPKRTIVKKNIGNKGRFLSKIHQQLSTTFNNVQQRSTTSISYPSFLHPNASAAADRFELFDTVGRVEVGDGDTAPEKWRKKARMDRSGHVMSTTSKIKDE
jgi:hypothetical protein